MEIHIVAPAVLLPIGPFINLAVHMKHYGCSATTIVNVEVGDASRRKHDDIVQWIVVAGDKLFHLHWLWDILIEMNRILSLAIPLAASCQGQMGHKSL